MRAAVILAGLATSVLVGCSGDRPVAGLCKPFPAANAAPAAEGAASLEDCLHRWAYTLAASDDDAGDVARAVMAACTAPLARWNQQGLGSADQPGSAPSLITGEPTNPIAERTNFAASRALFYVVQARAGDCKAPPQRSAAPMTGPDR